MVKTNDITQFQFVDDILPNDEAINKITVSIPTRLATLIRNVTNNSTDAFLELYADDYSLKPLSSPVLRRLNQIGALRVVGDCYIPTSTFYEFLFKALDSRYYDKWNNIYTALTTKYDLLKPYNMKRTETESNILGTTTDMDRTHSQSTTENNKETNTNSAERTENNSDTTTNSLEHTENTSDNNSKSSTRDINNSRTQNDNVTEDKNKGKDSVYGFNSTTAVGASESSNEATSKRNVTDTETNSDELTETNTNTGSKTVNDTGEISKTIENKETQSGTNETIEVNSGSQSGTQSTDIKYDSTRSITRTIERNGTTGNIMYQEMIEKELELRDYLLNKVMFKDISEYLTLGIYY